MSMRIPIPIFVSTFGLALLLSAAPAQISGSGEVVHVLPYSGPITPVSAEYLVEGIENAEREGAEAVIIRLDTPGGLDTAMRDIIKAELAASVPVIVFVAPGGSRAASAGVFITMAAHVAAMAPSTNIGSASPVSMGGAMDSTMTRKVTHDAVAYLESIARQRGRNVEMARAFVEDAANIPASQALSENVIDIIAPNVPALLDSLDGRVIALELGEHTLQTAGASIQERPMSWRQRMLKALADPNVAYILMLLGIYGLFFELSNPGALAPGILGGICIILALFAFQSLPVNYAGVALIGLGVIMLILEVKVTSFGALTIGGVVSMVLGSLLLFNSPDAWARVSLRVIVPAVLVFAGFFVMCVWLVVRGQRLPVTTGIQALIGEVGRVVVALPGGGAPGKVVFHGEMWSAVCPEHVEKGARVEVISIEGRVAHVRQFRS